MRFVDKCCIFKLQLDYHIFSPGMMILHHESLTMYTGILLMAFGECLLSLAQWVADGIYYRHSNAAVVPSIPPCVRHTWTL